MTSLIADPLPAEVARAVIGVLAADDINARVVETGAYLRRGLEDLQARYEAIGDVRGLLLSVEFVKDRESRAPDPELGAALTRRCAELGLSMNIVCPAR